jgi:microcystin-dependent protein
MGSGCNSGCSNYFGKTTLDSTVKYTGPTIPAFGICTNDFLSEVEAVILQKLIDYSTGVGISIPDIDLTTCGAFTGCTLACCNTCTDLPCLLECYKTAICSIFDDVTTLQTQVTGFLTGYDTKCLTGVTSTSLVNVVLQELITEFCTLVSAFNVLNSTLSGFTAGINTTIGNFLSSALGSCQTPSLGKTGAGATVNYQLKGFAPIGAIMPFAGNMTEFDSTGLGLAGTGSCGWAICNGNNGTVNMSGLIPMGTTSGSMGTPVIAGATLTTAYNTTAGEYNHTLTNAQVPATAVSVTGTHTHDITAVSDAKSTTTVSNNIWVIDCTTTVPGTVGPDASAPPYNIPHTFSGKISSVTQTLTGAVAGSGLSHNNMPPYRALYYIQRVS